MQSVQKHALKRATISLGFTSNWMKKWCEFFKLIMWRSMWRGQLLFNTQMNCSNYMCNKFLQQF